MADLYASLSPTAQADVRTALFGFLANGAAQCPTIDVSGIKSPDDLNDAGNRALAVDCFQTVRNVGAAAGVLDQATYSALVGWWTALPMWQKGAIIGGAVGTVGLIVYLARRKPKRLKA